MEHARVKALDGIRGAAVLMVLVHHAVNFAGAPSPLSNPFAALAYELHVGVDLFFVLSGYLITRILLDTKASENYFKFFYARRALRIFPLYYLFVACFVWLVPAFLAGHAGARELAENQAVYWLYASNFDVMFHGWPVWPRVVLAHAWSLAIEEQFYLVWPAAVRFLSPKGLQRAILITLSASVALRLVITVLGYGLRARVCTPAHLDGLMLGALFATLQALGTPLLRLRKLSFVLLGCGAVLRLLAWGMPLDRLEGMLIASWSAVFAGLLGLSLTSGPRARLNQLLGNRFQTFFGRYSYGIYLIHQPLFALVARYSHLTSVAARSALNLGLGGSVAVALAMLSYRYFEQPFLRLKSHFDDSYPRSAAYSLRRRPATE